MKYKGINKKIINYFTKFIIKYYFYLLIIKINITNKLLYQFFNSFIPFVSFSIEILINE